MPQAFRSPDPKDRPAWRSALEILAAGLAAADPVTAVGRQLQREGQMLRCGEKQIDLSEIDRVFLVAAGKAAVPMVRAAEDILGERLDAGVGVAPRGTEENTGRATIHGGGHPLPDPGSLLASRHIARLLDHTTERDLVIALISGGASALMELPAGRIPLIDIQATTSRLLASGATIDEINTVRKHLSRIKGGGLARLAAPAQTLSLILSDVIGNALDVVGSGPTLPDPTHYADAAAVLSRYDLWGALPASIGAHLREGMAGHLRETLKPADPILERNDSFCVGDNRAAVEAATAKAAELGYSSQVLSTWLQGEAREVGRLLASVAKEIADQGRPLAPPACFVAGGETTVTLRRLGGQGGRNQELALAAGLALDAAPWRNITIAAMGSDGIDGETAAAGAIVDGGTMARARQAGLDAAEALDRHDSGRFFETLGEAIVTGPTGTNVNDLYLVLVDDEGEASG